MILLIFGGIAALCLLLSFVCFMLVFYAPRKKNTEEFPVPSGPIYEPFRDTMIAGMKQMRAMPHETFTIRADDGLILSGRYFEYAPGAPMELMFHGYRGSADRDLCVGVQRCFALGRSALMVDQRTSGSSEGRIITFGVREYRDCLKWVDFAVEHFGPDVKIILTGISMGASTVLMAAGESLPQNVVGVLADCGFTSAPAIIKAVCRQIHLPGELVYPFVRLGARIFGGFDLEENSPIEAVKRCRVPVFFVHGEADEFVPCSMSRENFEACAAPKGIYTVPGAGHGLAYLVAGDAYVHALARFWSENGVPTAVQPDRINIT